MIDRIVGSSACRGVQCYRSALLDIHLLKEFMDSKVETDIMEAEAQAVVMKLKTNVKLEYTVGEKPTETNGASSDIIECLQVDSELNDLSRVEGVLSDAMDMIEMVKRKRSDIQTAVRDQQMKLRAELHSEKNRYSDYRCAVRGLLRSDRDEKIKLETAISVLEGQKETLEGEVSLMQVEQAELKRKWEQAVTINNFVTDEKTRLKADLQHLRDEKDQLGLDHVAMTANFEKEREKSLCQICMEAPKDTIYFPCLHLVACFSCSEKHRKRRKPCHTCWATVQSRLQLADQHNVRTVGES